MMHNRLGAALLEIIVATAVGLIVTGSAVLLLHSQSRLAVNVTGRSERNDAVRSALQILRAELQTLSPASDVRAVGRDSVSARIIRGVAVVCGAANGSAYAHYRGLRLPDPEKDSALQVGVENTIPIASARIDSSGCPARAGEQVIALAWPSGAPPVGSLWLLFERGGYHLSDRALRYRRGTEARQPITNELINDRSSAFINHVANGRAGIRIELQDRASMALVRDHIAFLNHP